MALDVHDDDQFARWTDHMEWALLIAVPFSTPISRSLACKITRLTRWEQPGSFSLLTLYMTAPP